MSERKVGAERSLDAVSPAASVGSARALIDRVDDVRRYLSRSLGLAALAWVGGALAVVMVIAWVLVGSEGWAPGNPIPLLLALTLLAVVSGAVFAWRSMARGWSSRPGVARAMDMAARLPRGSVLGSLEIAESLPAGSSAVLRDAALTEIIPLLQGAHSDLAGPLGVEARKLLRKGATCMFALAPLVALLAFVSPSRSANAWAGLVRPLAPFSADARAALILEPGDREVSRGEIVDVVVSAGAREVVTLFWETTGQVAQSRTLEVVDGRAVTPLPPVGAATRYWAESPDGARSRAHTLTPVDPLFVGSVTVAVVYPAHTGIPAEEFRNDVPALVLPVGSRLRIEGQGSRALGSAEIHDSEGEAVAEFDFVESGFSGNWVPRRSGTYAWAFTDQGGGKAAVAPQPLSITMVGDAAPTIAFVYPEGDTLLPINRRQPMVLEAADDYGLSTIEVVAWRISFLGEVAEPVTLRTDLGGTPAAVARPFLDVSGWDLMPGDTIRYFARAIDNSPGGQATQTSEFVLRVPQLTELERAAQEELDAASDRMNELANEAAQAEQEIQDLQRDAAQRSESGGEPTDEGVFENREEVRQAMERQDALLQAVDSLQRELAELRKALQEGGLADPQLSEELRSLEENLQDMDAAERRDDMRSTEEKLGEMDSEALEQAMEELAREQEKIRENLEASLEQFRQAAIDQDFKATSQEAEDLAREQQLLADAMEEGGAEQLRAEQQEALADRAEELQERLETLQERLQEAGEQDAGARLQEARHELSQAREQMAQAQQGQQQQGQQQQGQQQQGQQQQQAQEAAQQAAQQMSEVSQELQEAQQELQQEMAKAIQRALGQTANDALSLARRQSELREEMQGASREELAEMRADEAALAQGLRNLAENYANGTQMAAPGARDLMASVGKAMEGMEGTLDAMDGNRGRRASPMGDAQSVVEALNEVAMMAMAAGQQGEGQSSGSSGEQMMQQLQQLAQQQGDLMSEASTLSPMQLGQETMQQEMQEMAGDQEQIAEDLGQLSQDQEGEGEGEGAGDLGDLAAEAKLLAEAMAQGRLDPEVLRRQEELFHRLLDAGRTLEREEESEEREADAPGSFERNSVETLTAEAMNALRFNLPAATALQGLSPAQRNLVLKYFQRLNQVEGRPAGGGR